jgi:hypothetical protein
MSKLSVTSLVVLGAVLAACADGDTNRTVTGPDVRPAFDEAPGEPGFAATVDGPFDVAFTTDAPSAELAAAQIAASQKASTAGRASGHVGFSFGVPFLGIVSEQYSFVALGADPLTTLAAKGQFELMLRTVTGVEQKIHGDVVCMSTVGNTTRIAGQITKVWVNNVQRPITGATHTIWTVQDSGEGQGTTDRASLMFFNNAANAQTHCAVGFTPPLFANQAGNIQVRP